MQPCKIGRSPLVSNEDLQARLRDLIDALSDTDRFITQLGWALILTVASCWCINRASDSLSYGHNLETLKTICFSDCIFFFFRVGPRFQKYLVGSSCDLVWS